MNNFELTSGSLLPNLNNCADMVSSWLAHHAPQTKPKSVAQLVAEAQHSIYAMQGGHAIGHLALVPYQDNFLLEHGGGRHSTYSTKAAHIVVEGLVVKPGLEGTGIGTALLTQAMEQAATQAYDHIPVVVSALACTASYPLFEKLGFDSWGATEAWHDLHVTAPYDTMNCWQLGELGKGIVSKTVGR